ncbi:MAG: type II toxin-antitoxin system RelE/ParE family toxin [Gemmatimonadetes bacterium]|nr:type II toxin-antitoxin system RelE/ParE family toxin [Gemmatimonadota bacterium]MBI2537932.1 type II toxin-antitoxin system RelE/ParE family toxin [Gemmatimonadota bacterium]
MDQPTQPKPVIWVGPARRELKALPREVRRTMGIALWFAQQRRMHPAAAPMKGKQFAGVIEVREDFGRSTYRLMYVAKLGDVIYALCAFQKKATKGIATPKHLLTRVAERLRQAHAIHQQRGAEQ